MLHLMRSLYNQNKLRYLKGEIFYNFTSLKFWWITQPLVIPAKQCLVQYPVYPCYGFHFYLPGGVVFKHALMLRN